MKSIPDPTPASATAPDSEVRRQGRRRVVVGASVAAGAALAVTALRREPEAEAKVAGAADARTPAEGYRLTDHIRRYYETTRT